MDAELLLPRKWTLRAHGKQVVFVKKADESTEHVVMKALLWALYLPAYPNLAVEIPVGDRYRPDVVALDDQGQPHFWGEAGVVSKEKLTALGRRYRATHFALAKWDTPLTPVVGQVHKALRGVERRAPFDILCFPTDSVERFIGDDGIIYLTHDDLEWERL